MPCRHTCVEVARHAKSGAKVPGEGGGSPTNCWWFRNPAPVDMVNIPLFTRFYTSQVVVWDLFHQQYPFLDCTKIEVAPKMDFFGGFEWIVFLRSRNWHKVSWFWAIFVKGLSCLKLLGMPGKHLQNATETASARDSLLVALRAFACPVHSHHYKSFVVIIITDENPLPTQTHHVSSFWCQRLTTLLLRRNMPSSKSVSRLETHAWVE